jgi:hypothetical protein
MPPEREKISILFIVFEVECWTEYENIVSITVTKKPNSKNILWK